MSNESTEIRDVGGEGSGLSPKAIFAIVVVALAVILIAQNTGSGRFNLLFWAIEMPAWLWMVLLFLGGVAVGSLFPWLRRKDKS